MKAILERPVDRVGVGVCNDAGAGIEVGVGLIASVRAGTGVTEDTGVAVGAVVSCTCAVVGEGNEVVAGVTTGSIPEVDTGAELPSSANFSAISSSFSAVISRIP